MFPRAGWNRPRASRYAVRGIWNHDAIEFLLGPFVLTVIYREWFEREGEMIEFDTDYLEEYPDDPEAYITERGQCSNCQETLDFDDLSVLKFEVDTSGVQPGTPDGPAVHCAIGTIECPNCHDRLPFTASE